MGPDHRGKVVHLIASGRSLFISFMLENGQSQGRQRLSYLTEDTNSENRRDVKAQNLDLLNYEKKMKVLDSGLLEL